MKMITKLLSIFSGTKKIWTMGIAAIALVSAMGYGILRIQALDATISAREQRIEMVEMQYEQLYSQYDTMERDFREFAVAIQEDLNEQRLRNREIQNTNTEYLQRVTDLERTFMYDSDGNLRDWDDIIDNRSSALQQIINERTRGMGREFEEISSGR